MSLSIEVRWDEEVTKKLKKLGEKDLIVAREKRLKEASIILEWESKKEAPVKNWMLRKSITSKAYSEYAVVFTNLFYAPFVHEWTAPHIIMPKFKKALHWIDPNTWDDRFAKLVHHPGYEWNPFFTRAVENNEKIIVNRFYEIISEYTND